MTDKWFDEYNYEVVVHKSCLPAELLELLQKEDAIHLDPWDPMGALARQIILDSMPFFDGKQGFLFAAPKSFLLIVK